MIHRGFVVGGELAELAARLGRAPVCAASIEAERTVELQRERSRQERLEAELAAAGPAKSGPGEAAYGSRANARRNGWCWKCEEQERQRMDQERIEAELERSAELERQRMERGAR